MIADILTDAEDNMELAIEYAKDEFAAIRTGRATSCATTRASRTSAWPTSAS